MEQMVGKAKTAMEKCGLFQSHLNEWNQVTLENQNCKGIKDQFVKAYQNRLLSAPLGVPSTVLNVYELTEEDVEDNSVGTITHAMLIWVITYINTKSN